MCLRRRRRQQPLVQDIKSAYLSCNNDINNAPISCRRVCDIGRKRFVEASKRPGSVIHLDPVLHYLSKNQQNRGLHYLVMIP